MKKLLIILILFSGAFLTYALSDFIIDARQVKTVEQLTFDDLVEDGPKTKKTQTKNPELVTVKYWRFDSGKLPLLFGSFIFLVGCVLLLMNDKLRDKILN